MSGSSSGAVEQPVIAERTTNMPMPARRSVGGTQHSASLLELPVSMSGSLRMAQLVWCPKDFFHQQFAPLTAASPPAGERAREGGEQPGGSIQRPYGTPHSRLILSM